MTDDKQKKPGYVLKGADVTKLGPGSYSVRLPVPDPGCEEHGTEATAEEWTNQEWADCLLTARDDLMAAEDFKPSDIAAVMVKCAELLAAPQGVEPGPCPGCAKGEEPVMLDEHGTLTSISGLPGRMGHGVDDFWWYCDQYAAPTPQGEPREEEIQPTASQPYTDEVVAWRVDTCAWSRRRVYFITDAERARNLKKNRPDYDVRPLIYAKQGSE